MLVLLRIAVGWHFYSEGIDKRADENWSAAPFFANAKGPLAENYRQMVWDFDGKFRLHRPAIAHTFTAFTGQVVAHYGFSDEQRRQANANYHTALEQYDWVLDQNASELEEYELGRERIDRLDNDERESQIRDGVASLGGQRDTIRKEWSQKAKPALAQIDTLWENFEIVQNSIATSEQIAGRPPLRMVKPRTARVDTSVIDGVIPYFDIAIGLCLLLGLFTPIAALAGAGFLFSVFLSQYPPQTGPSSSNYQLIESMACFVLAGTGAGRFAGLDYFLHLIVRKFWHKPVED